ncbi:DUF7285 family protein [Halobaculum gomorrense]|uniref:Uncharacterized protein n=1 Tax=Halobaculum gomorrense TaxID=43928 RepID=A0A1M5TLF6_9EURY|nr:hypothetical protein [Halobaculum gomorrense]SHH51506.1 hypothetical protein SAMN05443636_2754 [Halobaculum gomorrense]
MSRSSSSRDRAFAEPTVALAAVLALSLGVAAYAIVLDGVGGSRSTPSARPALERVHEAVTVGGVADPGRLGGGAATAGTNRRMNVTLAVAGRRWSAGDATPESVADGDGRATATRRVGVALAPGRIRPGRLRVTVWR